MAALAPGLFGSVVPGGQAPGAGATGFGAYNVVTGVANTLKGLNQLGYAIHNPCKVDCGSAGNLRRFVWGTLPFATTVTEGVPDLPESVPEDLPGGEVYKDLQNEFDERVSRPAVRWLEGDRGAGPWLIPPGESLIPPQEYLENFDKWYDHLGGMF